MPQPLVELRDIVKAFNGHVVLDHLWLEVMSGEVMTIIGKSGVGKSVLLKHIIGLLAPDSGEIYHEGRLRKEMTHKEIQTLKSRFSYVFQNNALFDSLSVFENIALPLREKTRLKESGIRERVLAKVDELELRSVLSHFPAQISGGMQKRVALARALVTEPEVVLFDEPTTGLDPMRKNAVLSMIAQYQHRFQFTAVLVSHDIPSVFYVSDRVAILEEGRILLQGSPSDLEQTDRPVVRRFLNHLESLQQEIKGLQHASRASNVG